MMVLSVNKLTRSMFYVKYDNPTFIWFLTNFYMIFLLTCIELGKCSVTII